MKKFKKYFLFFGILMIFGLIGFKSANNRPDGRFLSYQVDPLSQDIKFYWKNDSGKILKSIKNLNAYVESKHLTLTFAMNGGMFNKEFSPQGLYIQEHKVLSPLDTASGNGNFYLKPNGVFFITSDNKGKICKTADFKADLDIFYATQSGPMLVINGAIHPAFIKGSSNLNIRNGVGILPNGNVLFVISKVKVNFYDFASYFKQQGCSDALYLDGYVSRMYLPEKDRIQTDGEFGVIIGVAKPAAN